LREEGRRLRAEGGKLKAEVLGSHSSYWANFVMISRRVAGVAELFLQKGTKLTKLF
jgi:hypothetical protein